MVNLQRRLERLEGKKGTAIAGPSVIFICNALTGESDVAFVVGGGSLTRKAGETSDAFMARAEAGATRRVSMPDNGRDALGR